MPQALAWTAKSLPPRGRAGGTAARCPCGYGCDRLPSACFLVKHQRAAAPPPRRPDGARGIPLGPAPEARRPPGAWIVLTSGQLDNGGEWGRTAIAVAGSQVATNRRTMTITKPIIIVGTGRCGSTLFHRLMAKHPQLMWMSPVCYKYPHKPQWNRIAVNAMDNPLLRRLFGEKIRPGENYRFWDKYAYGFSEPCRDLLRSDVSARVKQQVRKAFEPMLDARRNRLLIKITGWSRIGFLNEIFEDAKFIHMLRDGRAVASSLLHVNFWRGWYGPQGWRAGLLSAEDQATWESYDRSFTALAGIEWRIQMRAMEAARQALDPSRFFEVKYETFCEHPVESFQRALDFAEVPWSADFEREIRLASIRSTSNRWRDDLAPQQQTILDDLLREDLLRCGYGDQRRAERIPETAGR